MAERYLKMTCKVMQGVRMERCSVCGFMLAVSPACCIADHITSKKKILQSLKGFRKVKKMVKDMKKTRNTEICCYSAGRAGTGA